jgi:hypothetical protein
MVARKVLTLALPLVLAPLISGVASAQSQRRVAISHFGSSAPPLLHAPATPGATTVWVDTQVKTYIEGWTEYDPDTCTDISTGTYTPTTAPQYGSLFYDIEDLAPTGVCPGVLLPFNVARYTWTDLTAVSLQDAFALQWTTPDGQFTENNSFIAQLADITQNNSIWRVCGFSGGALPLSATLTLNYPPPDSASYVWTVTAGAANLVFSNGTATITTTANSAGITSLAASRNQNDVSINVVVQGLTYFFNTAVRRPWALKPLPDEDLNADRGADCSVDGDQGFLSIISYQVNDQFGDNTYLPDNFEAGVNESLGSPTASPQYPSENWGVGPAEGGNTTSGAFSDGLCRTGTTHSLSPQPEIPQDPLTTALVEQIPQAWFAGSSAAPPPNQGCEVQTDTINLFIDHGSHSDIVTPSLPPSPAPESLAAQAPPTGGATSRPAPGPRNVRDLAEQATVIVKGRVLEVSDVGTVEKQASAFRDLRVSFQVDSVLKGKVAAKVITVEIFENRDDWWRFTLNRNEYALLFLTGGQNGRYTFPDPRSGKMPITSQDVPLADAAQTTAGKLEAELFASFSDPDQKVARVALEQVGSLRRVLSTQPIRDIANHGAPEFQGLAHIALLKLGDYSLWNRAVAFAEQPVQDRELRRLQFGVARAIGHIEDRSVAPALNALLSSPAVILRRAAAQSLRHIGDPSSARFLVRALDDGDHDVQYDAMMGLGALVRYSHDAPDAPALGVFDTDPAKYLGAWKNWWETSGKRKYESGH